MSADELKRYIEPVDGVRLLAAFRKLNDSSLRAQAIAYVEKLAEEEAARAKGS